MNGNPKNTSNLARTKACEYGYIVRHKETWVFLQPDGNLSLLLYEADWHESMCRAIKSLKECDNPEEFEVIEIRRTFEVLEDETMYKKSSTENEKYSS